jgi:hypothetical protein
VHPVLDLETVHNTFFDAKQARSLDWNTEQGLAHRDLQTFFLFRFGITVEKTCLLSSIPQASLAQIHPFGVQTARELIKNDIVSEGKLPLLEGKWEIGPKDLKKDSTVANDICPIQFQEYDSEMIV